MLGDYARQLGSGAVSPSSVNNADTLSSSMASTPSRRQAARATRFRPWEKLWSVDYRLESGNP
ncbi:hypothetical protein ASPVEDRAFT_39650 [Aspergillus versicolor CBS 583.65]|uniref:Uncharacterized protein n=1 Tax=Aspergillus versicolor CBS 583.65 TaxID=1036611 RepID=A0A1L9PFC6_ASPVE|nr:uncharacterized protein ASPVEDRAFT_39650 [Aspergillus versicolor CBS 583.65]OJJ00218.1 hypothetical protein ASPVEDRAFT_39650 [Aspergillus versicolor CBS 583.65]